MTWVLTRIHVTCTKYYIANVLQPPPPHRLVVVGVVRGTRESTKYFIDF